MMPLVADPCLEVAGLESLEVVRYYLQHGCLPENIPASLAAQPAFQEIIDQLESVQQLTLALASGDLTPEVKKKGKVIGALKSLQANLRHLTWQTQRIAAGDLRQQVHFMGEYAAAFNQMVANLAQSRQELEERARELDDGKQEALMLMATAQEARQEIESAYARLSAQMEENQKLQLLLREQAIRDPLTSCYNRRYFDETINRELARARRESYPVSLVMMDIDHFKQVNDTHGHQAGDAVLRAAGELFKNSVRSGDMVIRFGGEEFLVVMPNVTLETALARSEIFRQSFAALKVNYAGRELTNTISQGVAVFPASGATSEQVLQAADEALYLAKQSGRNCVRTIH